jgi:hypothetical protein
MSVYETLARVAFLFNLIFYTGVFVFTLKKQQMVQQQRAVFEEELMRQPADYKRGKITPTTKTVGFLLNLS